MQIFLGYFIWGLILSVPLSWVVWRLNLLRYFPKLALPQRGSSVKLPPQLGALVIRGVRQRNKAAG